MQTMSEFHVSYSSFRSSFNIYILSFPSPSCISTLSDNGNIMNTRNWRFLRGDLRYRAVIRAGKRVGQWGLESRESVISAFYTTFFYNLIRRNEWDTSLIIFIALNYVQAVCLSWPNKCKWREPGTDQSRRPQNFSPTLVATVTRARSFSLQASRKRFELAPDH
jgi:hypothetical protein